MALPNQPTAPTTTAISEGIKVTWAAASGATSYDIQADNHNNYSSPEFDVEGHVGTSIIAQPLANGTGRYVRIRSRNDEGTSNWVTVASNAATTPLASLSSATAPSSNLDETDGSGLFRAGWDAPTGATDGTTEYELAYSQNSATPNPQSTAAIFYITTTARTLRVPETGEIANGTWYWWVRTLSDDDTGPSAWSARQTSTPSLGEGMDAPTVTLDDQSFQVFMSWTEVDGATSYDLRWGTSSNYAAASTTLIENISPDDRSELFTGLNNGTTYYFQVRTNGPDGTGNWSTSMGSRPDYVDGMAAPTVTLVAESEQARLSWTAVPNATAYDYVYGTTSSTPGNVISALSTAYTAVEDVLPGDLGPDDNGSILITGLTNGTTYRFWVRTKGPSGVGSWSTVKTVAPSTANGAPLPTNLAVEIGSQLGRLTWDGDDDDLDYDYTWGTHSTRTNAVNNSVIDENDLPGRMLLLPVPGTDQDPLRNDVVNYFWVRARSAKGYSAWTASVSATPSATNAPLTPIGLNDRAVGETEVELEFELSADATDYDYRYKITTDTEYTEVTTEVTEDPDIEEGYILVTGLLPNTDYHFSVRSKHDQGPSDWSDDITITTMAIPSGLAAVGGDERVLLIFDTDSAATDYDYRYKYPGIDWIEITQTAITGSPILVDQGISNNTEYEFQVRATNTNSTTYWTHSILVRPTKPQLTRPAGLMATGGPAEVLLEWEILAAGLLYDLRYRERTSDPWIQREAIPVTRVVIHNLTVGSHYEFQVRATNEGGGVSEWTETVTATPTDATLTDPEISEITVSPVAGSQEVLLTVTNDLPGDVEVQVAVEVQVPGEEYSFAYELPGDFLKVVEVLDVSGAQAGNNGNGEIEPVLEEPEGNLSQTKPVVDGDLLYTDILNPLLKYIGSGNERSARGSFRLIAATLLASGLARKYQKNIARAQELLAEYERHLPLALASVDEFVDYKALQFETVQDSDQGTGRQ